MKMVKKLLYGFLLLGCFATSAQTNSFCLEIFNDLDGDGIIDDTEQGIEAVGVTIISAPVGTPYPLPYTITTSTNGMFCFNNLPDGVYTLQIDVPTGWQVSNGGSPYLTITMPASTENSTFRFALQGTLAAPHFDKAAFSVYPNPAKTLVNILAERSGLNAFMLYDISGREVLHGDFAAQGTIDVSTLPGGIYYIRMISESFSEFRKIIVEN